MRLLLILTAAAVLAGACDSGGSASPASTARPDATSTAEPRAVAGPGSSDDAAQAAAGAALLTLDDLPAGWTAAEPEDEEEDDDLLARIDECTMAVEDPGSDAIASAESDEFSGPDDESVSSDASVFETDEQAAEALRALAAAFDGCRDEFVELVNSAFTEGVAEDGADAPQFELETSFEDLDVEGAADDAVGYRIEMHIALQDVGLELNPVIEFVFLRQGRVGGSVFYFALEEDAAMRPAVTEIVADRLAKADDSLSD